MSPPDLQHAFSGEIPKYYDECLGPAWFGPIAADLARRAPVDPGGDALEVACGTGLQTRALRERLDPKRRLVATDLNAPMLEYARGKMAGVAGIDWRVADGMKLPFADGDFALVACSLGIMFMPDKPAFASGVRRVLRPGGTFLFNVWDRIEENPCAHAYARMLEEMFPGDAEIHFNAPYLMHDRAKLRALVEGAGFEVRKLDTVRLPVGRVAPRDVATGQIKGTPRGLLLAQRGIAFDEAIDKATAALEKACGRGAAFRAHCQVVAVEAVAP